MKRLRTLNYQDPNYIIKNLAVDVLIIAIMVPLAFKSELAGHTFKIFLLRFHSKCR